MGGATIFGLVGGIVNAALGATNGLAALITFSNLPVLLVVAAIGIGGLMLGSRCMTESISLDQESQARKIAKQTRGPNQESSLAPQQTTPGLGMDRAVDEAPAKQWAAQFTERASPASFAEKAHAPKAADANAAVDV